MPSPASKRLSGRRSVDLDASPMWLKAEGALVGFSDDMDPTDSKNPAAGAYAVRHTISDAELAQAKAAFFGTDQECSGAIDREELSLMLKNLGQNPTKTMIEEIFTEADSNRADGNINGKIELREFLCWYGKQLQKKSNTAHDDVANVYRALGGVPAPEEKGEGSPGREQKTISKPELRARLKAEYDLDVNVDELFPSSSLASPTKELMMQDFEALLLGSKPIAS